MEWYLKVLKNYAGFSGRARRKEYWMFFLFNVIASGVLWVLDALVGTAPFLGGLYFLAVVIPGIAVTVRRLHDTGRSGWWLLIVLVPVIGSIALLVFMAQEGHAGANLYGPNPKELV
jgi:uncharacterized membrane protein YhaH (DUF805 family)